MSRSRSVVLSFLLIAVLTASGRAACTAEGFVAFSDATEQIVDYKAKGTGECGDTNLQWRFIPPSGNPSAPWGTGMSWTSTTPQTETPLYGLGFPCAEEGVHRFQVRAWCGSVVNNACVRNETASAVDEKTFTIRWASTLDGLALGPFFTSPNVPHGAYPLLFHSTYINGPRSRSGFVQEWLPTDRTSATPEGSVSVIGVNNSNWEGTAQANVAPNGELLMITPTLCDDRRRGSPQAIAVPESDNSCDTCCGGPGCVGHPIRISNGNMRYVESDPLPTAPGFSLTRTYDTNRSLEKRWFGAGWSSPFDAWLRIVDDSDSRTVVIGTPNFGRMVFHKKNTGSSYTQIWPVGEAPATLVDDSVNGVYRVRKNQADTELVFRTSDNRLGKIRYIPTGREISIVWNNGAPAAVEDSWQNWRWTVQTDANSRITQISVDGTTAVIAYTYDGSGNMTAVKLGSPEKTWRTYVYASGRMTEARDTSGRLLESHAYDANGNATTSVGPGGDITALAYGGSGRVAGEEVTIVTTSAGQTTSYYTRYRGGRRRTVEISGGCSTCGSRSAVYAHADNGDVLREQDDRGYITVRTYDQGREVSESGPWKPSACDPETASDRCRQTPDTLATVALAATTATRTRTTVYGDANWPDKATLIATESVTGSSRTRTEAFTYDAATGVRLTHTVTGWTGSPSAQQTRTTIVDLNDGTTADAAPFNPGPPFDSAWLSLAQPKSTVRSIDGPRPGADIAYSVYYPIDASVPAALRGHLAATRNVLGHITVFADYDAFGNARRIIDPNGVFTERTFDSLGRLLTSTLKGAAGCNTSDDPLCATDLVSTVTYENVVGPLATETRPLGGTTVPGYDSRGRVVTTSRGPAANDLRERIEAVYDSNTALKTVERLLAFEGGAWVARSQTNFWYDTEGRVTTTLRGLDTETNQSSEQNSYGPGDLLAATKDGRHSAFNTKYAYDPAGRLASVEQLSNATTNSWITTRYSYDIAGNLTKVRDPNGNETIYVYDDFGQMLQQTSPVTGVTTYSYDAAGDLVSTTDAAGNTTARTYDIAGRVLTSVSSRTGAATESVSWTYDQPGGVYGIGRLTTMTDATGSTTYRYERRGLLAREEKTFSGAVSDPSTWTYVTKFEYDRDGNRSKIGYPSGQSVTYTYDFAGRPLTAAPFVTGASYLPFGPGTQIVYGNGTTRTMQYDGHYRITKNKLAGPAGTLAEYDYTYDNGSNITAIADVTNSTYNRSFGYDDLSRLVTADTGTSLWGTGGYSYDAMGNVLALTIGASPAIGARTASFAYSGTTSKVASAIENGVGRNVQYDAAGNETSYSVNRTYSARNLLDRVERTLVESPTAIHRITYGYDGRGIRVARAEGNAGMSTALTAKRFYVYTPELQLLMTTSWDRLNPFKSSQWANLIETEYVWFNGAPVAQTAPFHLPPPRYTFTDHLGTPLIQTDPSGTVIWRAEYEPYGNVFAMRTGTREEQPLRFPGQEAAMTSEGTEENYNVYRWYRSGWGRYTQSDPVHGPRLFMKTGRIIPPSSNPDGDQYTYTGGNPIRFTDPDGLYTRPCSPTDWRNCQGDCDKIGKRLVGCGCYGMPFCFGMLNYSVAQCKDYQNGCPACPPPPPPRIDRVPPHGTANTHFGCPGDHWHWTRVDQGPPPGCICRYTDLLGGCL